MDNNRNKTIFIIPQKHKKVNFEGKYAENKGFYEKFFETLYTIILHIFSCRVSYYSALTLSRNINTIPTMIKATPAVDIKEENSSNKCSVFARIARLYDRLVFRLIHRGRRIRPEALEVIEKEIEDEKQEKTAPPKKFANTKDMMEWLNS